MNEFLSALSNTDIPFLRYAFIAGILSSAAFGVTGTYIVVRRISYLAGAISHSVLAGIGFAVFLQDRYGITWFTPLTGAWISAILAALIIGLVNVYARQREDTTIGAIWAVGMATGLAFLSGTSSYVDPMSYLFGNILLITRTDLILISVLDLLVVFLGLLFYHQFLAVSFDEEFSRARGLPAGFYYLILLFLTAMTVVLMVTIVGIVMVIALLTLPAAVAGLFSRHLWQMILFSSLLCIMFTSVGIGVSYITDLPTGATIILLAGGVYLLALVVKLTASKIQFSKH
ncbi:MAG: metal ABC transporter permease [Spirochaetes bacterium]|nr:MAG: metal ABC transporter permease [Spirochaetota bacterium]